jgi:hypothetical protein
MTGVIINPQLNPLYFQAVILYSLSLFPMLLKTIVVTGSIFSIVGKSVLISFIDIALLISYPATTFNSDLLTSDTGFSFSYFKKNHRTSFLFHLLLFFSDANFPVFQYNQVNS